MALLCLVFVVGAYVDAWSRQAPDHPLGPWQDAIADAGWFLATAFMVAVLGMGLRAGRPWRDALPAGYHLALAGGLVFGLGVVADVYYQIAFGPERGLESLLAPPHVIELVGGGLLVGAPLAQALRERPERAGWPVVLSGAMTLAGLTFFSLFANPVIDLWAARRGGAPAVTPWVGQNLGVAAVVIQVSLLVGVMLLLVRSFAVPRGSLTVLCALDGLCLVIVSRHVELFPFLLVTGIGADVLLMLLRPDAGGTAGLRVFATAVPVLYALGYWVSIEAFEGGSAWSARLWVGVVLAAALAGFLVSYVAGIRRPPSIATAEALEERRPRHHVDVTQAAVKDALDALDDPAALAASPLATLSCVMGAPSTLRDLLIDVVRELAATESPRDAEAGRLLLDYYVKRVGSHDVIAERLHLSRPTFYRRLQRGLTLAAERIDTLEDFAAGAERR